MANTQCSTTDNTVSMDEVLAAFGVTDAPNPLPTLWIATRGITETFTREQRQDAFEQLSKAMETPDPENHNLRTITIDGQTVWGILDERVGDNGEDALTMLFPHEY